MSKDSQIVRDYDERYTHAFSAYNAFFPRAAEDLRFFLGDQWTEQERQALYDENRTALTINRIKPNINMLTGHQRKHRLSSIVLPVQKEDQLIADQASQLLLYTFQHGDYYEAISDAYEGALITGWNLLSIFMDYRYDPMGEIAVSREPYNAFITDPYFSKKDLTDCSYVMRRKYISLEQAISLLPDHKKDLERLYDKGAVRDDKFTWLPYQQFPSGQIMLAYDEYWEQGFEKVKVILDMATGDEIPYKGHEDILYASESLQVIDRTYPFVEQHIIVNNEFMETTRNPFGLNEYPFVPFFAVFMPESDLWALKIQSIVRTMKDSQRESNKRRSQMIDLIESQLNSGWIAEDGSVMNPRSLFQTGQGRVIWRKKGSDPGALTRLDAAQIPPSFFQAKDGSDQDIQFSANVSDELLGQADSEQDSGLKVALRQQASLVGLQGLADNARFAQKLLTRKVLKLIHNLPSAKLKRILGEEPDPRLLKPQGFNYDIAVQEGPLTATQQQMFFQQVVTLKELGEPVPPGFLAKIAPLQGKSEYVKAMDEYTKSQQQQAQEQQKVQDSLLQSQQLLAQSQSLYDLAGAKERMMKAESDTAEKAAKIVDERADSVLRRIEAIKRLEDLDDSRLDRLIGMIERMDIMAQADEDKIKAETEAKAQLPSQQQEVPSGIRQQEPAVSGNESPQGEGGIGP